MAPTRYSAGRAVYRHVQCVTNDLELFLRVMAELVVLHAETVTWVDEIAVVGFSSAFDEVEDGDPIPINLVCCASHPAGFDPAGDSMAKA